MDMASIIAALRRERGWTQQQLADALRTSQNNVSRWIGGVEPRGRLRDALQALARESGLLPADEARERRVVPVMGRIGGGAEIEPDYEQVPEDGIEQIELPYTVGEEMIGFRVVGDSMAPTYEENAIILVEREQPFTADSMIGMTAAVLAYGPEGKRRRYLKRIRPGGRPHTFSLESVNDRSPTIRDVRIIWASPVRMIIPNIGLRRVKAAPRARGERPGRAKR